MYISNLENALWLEVFLFLRIHYWIFSIISVRNTSYIIIVIFNQIITNLEGRGGPEEMGNGSHGARELPVEVGHLCSHDGGFGYQQTGSATFLGFTRSSRSSTKNLQGNLKIWPERNWKKSSDLKILAEIVIFNQIITNPEKKKHL